MRESSEFFNERKFEEAIRNLDGAIRQDPTGYELYFSRGYYYAELGRYHQAIEDYDKAIQINPQNEQPKCLNISWLYAQDYCEYQVYLDQVNGVTVSDTPAMVEGSVEH